jgi:hypothetical protein
MTRPALPRGPSSLRAVRSSAGFRCCRQSSRLRRSIWLMPPVFLPST